MDLAAGGGLTPRRRRRATYTRPHGVRHLLAAYDLSRDKLYGHTKPRKRRGEFLVFLRYLRTLYPPRVRGARRSRRPGNRLASIGGVHALQGSPDKGPPRHWSSLGPVLFKLGRRHAGA